MTPRWPMPGASARGAYVAGAVVLGALPLLGAAQAPPSSEQLRQAELSRAAGLQALREATARAQDSARQARALADQRVAAAARLRAAEAATGDAATRVGELAARARAAEARLAEREATFQPLLPLLERLSLYPAETLIAMPMPPEQAVRGVLVLGGISRQLESEAVALRDEQAQVRALQALLRAEYPRLAAAEAAQEREAAGLDQQIAAAQATRSAAEDAASQAAQQAAAEAARADGLRAAIARIDAQRQAAEAQARAAADAATRQNRTVAAADARQRQEALARPAGPGLATSAGTARGGLTSPVAGSIVHAFGAESDAGPASGVSYQAPPAARVVSPCDGRVVFSGPFRSYGQLLIVDCGGGFHVVLAGLDRLDASAGHPVQSGEPVGVMPAWDPRATTSRPTLYVELRRQGEPVDPAPFLRAKS